MPSDGPSDCTVSLWIYRPNECKSMDIDRLNNLLKYIYETGPLLMYL